MNVPMCLVIAGSLIAFCAAEVQTSTGAPDPGKTKLMQQDYEALTGRWQLVQSVVDGKPVSENEVRKTILITDLDTFRFPPDAGVGTAPLGRFVIDPTKNPKHVDSTALAGPDKGKVTPGIYEILDGNNKRACWARPGEPRPTDFTSPPWQRPDVAILAAHQQRRRADHPWCDGVGSKADLLSTDFLRAMWLSCTERVLSG